MIYDIMDRPFKDYTYDQLEDQIQDFVKKTINTNQYFGTEIKELNQEKRVRKTQMRRLLTKVVIDRVRAFNKNMR